MGDVVLYDYWRSSASYRVRIALNLAGIEYRTIPVNLLDAEHKNPDYLSINPQGLVPTLVIDGITMTQSLSIVEYLAETRTKCGLLPTTPAARQRVRALAHAIAMEIHPICNLRVTEQLMALTQRPDGRDEWMRHFITDGLRKVEAMLVDTCGIFSVGDNPTMADLCLVPQVYNARRWDVNLKEFSTVLAIDERCLELPSFHAASPNQSRVGTIGSGNIAKP